MFGFGPTWLVIIVMVVYFIARSRSQRRERGNGASIPSQQGPGPPSLPPPGWYSDPSGRYAQRYWDGQKWESAVRNGLDVTQDPIPAPASSGPGTGQDTQ